SVNPYWSRWQWASVSPGVTARPPRSTTRHPGGRSLRMWRSLPTAATRPSRIRSAWAWGNCGSRVWMRPLTRANGSGPADRSDLGPAVIPQGLPHRRPGQDVGGIDDRYVQVVGAHHQGQLGAAQDDGLGPAADQIVSGVQHP